MALRIEIQNAKGESQGESWTHPSIVKLLGGDHTGTSCLRFIDPHGDTLFNQQQLSVLLAELRALGGRLKDPTLAPMLRELVAFVQPAGGKPQLYVRFIGE